MEVSPPMFIQNLRLLKCPTVVKGMQKTKNDLPGWLSLLPMVPTIDLIYSHCLSTLISLIQEQTITMLQGHQDSQSWIRDHFLQKQNGLYPHML